MVNIKSFFSFFLFVCLFHSLNGQLDQEYIYTADQNLSISDIFLKNDEILLSGHYFADRDTRDLLVMRSDFDGNILESISFGSTDREGSIKNGFYEKANGEIVIFGNTTYQNSSPVIDDPFYIRLDQNLNVLNKQSWGTPTLDEQFSFIDRTSDGGSIAVGLFGWSEKGGMIVKLDQNNTIQWSKKYATTNAYLFFASIVELEDGSFICSGVNQIDADNSTTVIIKLDANGNVLSQNEYVLTDMKPRAGSDFFVYRNGELSLFYGVVDDLDNVGLLRFEISEQGNVLSSNVIFSDLDFSISGFYELSNTELLLSGAILNEDFSEGLILKWSNDEIVEGFSKQIDNRNVVVSDLASNCLTTDCSFYIGVNISDIDKNGHFSIVQSQLDCPDLDGDRFMSSESQVTQQAFSQISEHIIGEAENFLVTDEFVSNVTRIEKNLMIELGNDTMLCANTQIILDASNPNANGYEWSTGEFSSKIAVESPGIYTVTLTDGCQNFVDQIRIDALELPPVEVFLPNVFSPNQDGINDCFEIQSSQPVEAFSLSIFNRWGNLVFYSEDLTNCWDGKIGGTKVVSDVYVYQYSYSYFDCANLLQTKNGNGDVLVH